MEGTRTVPQWHADFQEKVLGRFNDLEVGQSQVIGDIRSLTERVAKQNGAVAKLQEEGNRMALFVATHPRDCEGIAGLRDDIQNNEIRHSAEVAAVRTDLLRERVEKMVETVTLAATKKERARWFRGIPKLAYVVFVLVVLLFIGNAKGWIAALAAATKAIAP